MKTRSLTEVIIEPHTYKNWILCGIVAAVGLGALTIVYQIIFYFYILMIGLN